MGLRGLFRSRRWQPDVERDPPPSEDWPDHVVTLKKKNFATFIDKYPLSVIDFWAPWCGPCKKIAPRIRQLSKLYTGTVAFGKVNIDDVQNMSLAKEYKIMGIPNLMFFSYGERVTSITGVRPVNSYKDKIESILEKFE
jgi:thioredoxin 1